MTKDELREKLAELEHDRWSRWEKYRERASCPEKEAMWERKRETPYSELTHQEQESDRVEAYKTLEIVWPLIEQAGQCADDTAREPS